MTDCLFHRVRSCKINSLSSDTPKTNPSQPPLVRGGAYPSPDKGRPGGVILSCFLFLRCPTNPRGAPVRSAHPPCSNNAVPTAPCNGTTGRQSHTPDGIYL